MAVAIVKIAAFAFAAALASETTAEQPGFYARAAVPIWDKIAGAPPSESLDLVSPDGKTSVAAHYDEDKGVTLQISGRLGVHEVDLGPGVGSELLWSPNSDAFAVTTSDDGANGNYRTIVVSSEARGFVVKDLTPLVEAAFGHPVKCGSPEDPNVGAFRWTGPDEIVAAAEIVSHSNCDSFGTFRAYAIDLRAMRVVKTFDQIEAKRRFSSSLGAELRSAPDECVRSPRRCWVSTNHPRAPSRGGARQAP
jgi:hypothetical protein